MAHSIMSCLPACLIVAAWVAEPVVAQVAEPFETEPQLIRWVNPLNPPGNPATGVSMQFGFRTLEDALLQAAAPNQPDLTVEIRLLGNQVYIPDGSIREPMNSPDPRDATFALPPQVLRISGGWVGSEPPGEGPAGRPSTLSGDRGVSGVPTDNCYHVVVPSRNSFSTNRDAQWLDYLIVEDGYADGSSVAFRNQGGGILVAGGQLRLTEVTVRDCFARFGGGVAAVQASAGSGPIDPSFWARRSTFRDCVAEVDGGGILVDRCKRVVIMSCVGRNNSAGNNGGGIWVGTRIPDHAIVNSVFHDNTASNLGGAVYVTDHFSGNAGLRIVNCTIAYNAAGVDQGIPGGSGLYLEFDSGSTGQPLGLARTALVNTIVYANPGVGNDDNILLAIPPTPPGAHVVDVTNCFIGGRTTNPNTGLTTGNFGYGLPAPAVAFIDAGATGEVPGWVNPAARNFRLQVTSRCIDQGTDLAFQVNNAGNDFMDLDSDRLYFEQTTPPDPATGVIQEMLCREHFMGDEQWLNGSVTIREVRVPLSGASTLPIIGQDGGQANGAITDIGAFEYRIYQIGV